MGEKRCLAQLIGGGARRKALEERAWGGRRGSELEREEEAGSFVRDARHVLRVGAGHAPCAGDGVDAHRGGIEPLYDEIRVPPRLLLLTRLLLELFAERQQPAQAAAAPREVA